MEKLTCRKCNEEKPLKEFYYHRNRQKYMTSCKKCNSKSCKEYQQNSGYRKTEDYVFYQRAYGIKRERNHVPIMDNLKEYLKELWVKQEGICHYSKLKMSLTGYHKDDMAMTVDRMIPENGYVKGNIVLSCSIINRMKQNLSIDELVKWCNIIIKNVKSTNFVTLD